MPMTSEIRIGPMPDPAQAPPAVGGRGHERVGAVVHVEHGGRCGREQQFARDAVGELCATSSISMPPGPGMSRIMPGPGAAAAMGPMAATMPAADPPARSSAWSAAWLPDALPWYVRGFGQLVDPHGQVAGVAPGQQDRTRLAAAAVRIQPQPELAGPVWFGCYLEVTALAGRDCRRDRLGPEPAAVVGHCGGFPAFGSCSDGQVGNARPLARRIACTVHAARPRRAVVVTGR